MINVPQKSTRQDDLDHLEEAIAKAPNDEQRKKLRKILDQAHAKSKDSIMEDVRRQHIDAIKEGDQRKIGTTHDSLLRMKR
jgi:uncharacterized membrane protein